MRIVGILLAAGKGERFGGDKLLAPLPGGPERGTPLGVLAARRMLQALPETLAIVRPDDATLALALGREGLRVVICADADEGMGASLACGVAAARDAGAWVVGLADMPWIAPATITAVAGRLRAGASLVAPTFRGQRGHPVGFAARHGTALRALHGDTGARDLIAEHAGTITLIDVADAGVLRDVDVPTDLHADQ
jgi:molybdenum cofactor cytidylyltransferase